MPFIKPEDQIKQLLIYYPRKVGGRRGATPTPPTPSVEVSIAPSSAVQYENVILSASTTGTSPTFIWTLTDFYDTTDTQVSSYTGATLTEGYFTSTGSSNVSVSVTCVEGAGSTSTFSVTAFDVSSLSPDLWYDPSDASSLTLREDAGNYYVEQINNKGTLSLNLAQATASHQPQYSASTINNSLSVMYGDGVSNVLLGDYGSSILSISGRTTFLMTKYLDKRGQGFPNNDNMMYWTYITLSREGRYFGGGGSGIELLNNGSYSTRFRQSIPFSGEPTLYTWIRENNVGLAEAEYNGISTWDLSDSYTQPYNFRYVSIMRQYPSGTNDFWGEWCEWIHFHRTITTAEKDQINRYMNYKWFGSMTY